MTTVPDLLDHALETADLGMRIFRVHGIVTPGHTEAEAECSCSNTACISPGKHPVEVGWQAAATASHSQIRRWFGNGGTLNYGIALGGHRTAVDVDRREGGSLRALRDLVGVLGPILMSGFGWHVFYEEANVPNATKLGPGMQVRSDGLFVVGPGSTHYTGRIYGRRRYGWDPECLLKRPPLVVPATETASANGREPISRELPDTIYDGEERWRKLQSLAGTLCNRGLSESAIVEHLDLFNERQCNPPKDAGDVRRLAAWVVEHDGSTVGLRETIADPDPAARKARQRDMWVRRTWEDKEGKEHKSLVEHPAGREQYTVAGITVELSGLDAYKEPDQHRRLIFQPPLLGEDLIDVLGLARGPGGGLWFDAGGVYRPEAEKLIEDLVRRVLGKLFRKARLAEVLGYCKTLFPTISTDPPPEHLLNLANGVLDIDTLELRPVDPDERFTYRIPIDWNPTATCSTIERFLGDVLPDDARELVVEILGYCLLPTPRFRRAVMLIGDGSNGKSVILELIRALVGKENCATETLHDLQSSRWATSSLFGRLVNVSGDLDARQVEGSDVFKMLTGGDPVSAERKYGDKFSFVNFATLIFSANEWPVSSDQSNAYFTRWHAIGFGRVFVEEDRPLAEGERRADPKILEKLTTPSELEGLLVLAVEGARRLRERGAFRVPPSTRRAVADYRAWASTVIAWVEDRVEADPGRAMSRSSIYADYTGWCETNGRKGPLGTRKFWPKFRDALKERGIEFEEVMSMGDRKVYGIVCRD